VVKIEDKSPAVKSVTVPPEVVKTSNSISPVALLTSFTEWTPEGIVLP